MAEWVVLKLPWLLWKIELKGYYLFYRVLLPFSFLSLLLLFFKAQLQSRQLSLSHILSASTGTNKN